MIEKIPMTVVGAKALEEELQHLKKTARPQVIQAIAEARAHGDLKENAEYHEARRQQSFIEGRIQELEGKLSHAQVIDVSKLENVGKVVFGATVVLYNVASEQEVIYQIVGEDEADIKSHKISFTSPIARALIGKTTDAVVEVHAPSGVIEYEIVSVKLD